jgi:hypothetical protein
MMNHRVINIKGMFHLLPMPHLTSPEDVSYLGAHRPVFIVGETPVLTVWPKFNYLPISAQLWPPRNNIVRD